MAAIGQMSTGMSVDRTLSSSRNIGVALSPLRRTLIGAGRSSISLRQCSLSVRSIKITEDSRKVKAFAENGALDVVSQFVFFPSPNCCFLVCHVLFDSFIANALVGFKLDTFSICFFEFGVYCRECWILHIHWRILE